LAFAELFRELYPSACRLAYRLIGNADAAEDVAMEALARAFARWDAIAALPYRDAWVMRVTTNIALSALRRRPLPAIEREAVAFEDAVTNRLLLAEALNALPRRQREAIVLRHLAGLSEREIAATLDIAPETVKTHLKRGIGGLRRELTAPAHAF